MHPFLPLLSLNTFAHPRLRKIAIIYCLKVKEFRLMNFIIFRKKILYIKRCALLTLIFRTYLYAGFFLSRKIYELKKVTSCLQYNVYHQSKEYLIKCLIKTTKFNQIQHTYLQIVIQFCPVD